MEKKGQKFQEGFQEENEQVTPPSRRDMLLAMQTLRKGLLFRNADQWSLLCKLDDAVEQGWATFLAGGPD